MADRALQPGAPEQRRGASSRPGPGARSSATLRRAGKIILGNCRRLGGPEAQHSGRRSWGGALPLEPEEFFRTQMVATSPVRREMPGRRRAEGFACGSRFAPPVKGADSRTSLAGNEGRGKKRQGPSLSRLAIRNSQGRNTGQAS
jgi:hypothetical protein